MTKKKRQKAIEERMASVVNAHLQVQINMVLMEVGTRMGRIERKVDEIMKFFGIEGSVNTTEGGVTVNSKEAPDKIKLKLNRVELFNTLEERRDRITKEFILDTVQKAMDEKRLVIRNRSICGFEQAPFQGRDQGVHKMMGERTQAQEKKEK